MRWTFMHSCPHYKHFPFVLLSCTVQKASIPVGQDRDRQMLQCDSLRVFIEEEVKYLTEAVTVEEKNKFGQKTEESHPSFVLNPHFSPIVDLVYY